MKKEYSEAKLEVLSLDLNDVIVTSRYETIQLPFAHFRAKASNDPFYDTFTDPYEKA